MTPPIMTLGLWMSSDQVLTEEQVRGETQDYYESRGWDRETGLPQADTVERLGLQV